MSSSTQILLSGALTFGVPLILAIRELVLLRRQPRGGWGGDEPRQPAPPPPDLTPAHKPLPDCLIPKPLPMANGPARTRVLEPA